MLAIIESPARIADRERVLEKANRYPRVALRIPLGQDRDRWLEAAARQHDAQLVHVPREGDRIARVLLDLASRHGDDTVEQVAQALRKSTQGLDEPLALLERAMKGTRLVVEGWGALRSSRLSYDLGYAQNADLDQLRGWLERHTWIVSDRALSPPANFETVVPDCVSDVAPLRFDGVSDEAVQALWQQLAPDEAAFELALVQAALLNEFTPAVAPWLQADVEAALPERLRDALTLLALHGRPLTRAFWLRLGLDEPLIEQGQALGLWHVVDQHLIVSTTWRGWSGQEARREETQLHRKLADAFATQVRPEDPAADRAALALLEAHRHYLAAGDEEMARRFARYSAALLVEAGRSMSMARNYAGAVRQYQAVLDLAAHAEVPLGAPLRGYVVHYLHFNRAKADMEQQDATEEAYRKAVELWPSNALFWSRLIRVQFYRDHPTEALSTLRQALANPAIPPHAERNYVLIARTMKGLLRNQRIMEAIQVWGDYQPDTLAASEAEAELVQQLDRGWRARRIVLPATQVLAFHRDQDLRIRKLGPGSWLAELRDLQFQRRGVTPAKALETLTTDLRDEATGWSRAFTHQLDAAARLRKQSVLGVIDVIASRVDDQGTESTWVFGDLRRDVAGIPWLHTGGAFDLRFEVPEGLLPAGGVAPVPFLAEVKADPSGVPIGPVIALEPGFDLDSADVWKSWRERLARGS